MISLKYEVLSFFISDYLLIYDFPSAFITLLNTPFPIAKR